MEEDVKIIEEMLNSKEPACNYILKHQEIEAISNLLTRYKQLEEDNKEIKKEFAINTEIHKRDEIIKDLKETINCLHETDKENYIPKSKVKEKIEELEREFDFYAGREHFEWQDGEFDGEVCDDIALKIGVLKELLREE